MEGDEGWVWVRRPADAAAEAAAAVWAVAEEPARPLKIVFDEPAKHWTDAAPIGNGRLGAMIWGGVASEKLQLNHDTLWTGVPGNYTNSKAPAVLSKVRKLVDKGQYSEATLAAFDLSGASPDVYQPLGNLNLDFGDLDVAYTDYVRELDLTTATANVTYALGDVVYTREHFSSNPHQVLVTKISANKSGRLSLTVSLDSQLHHHSTANAESQIIMEGSCPGKRNPPKENAADKPAGIKFSAILDLQIGGDNGTMQVLDGKKLRVDGADWVVLLLAASSSFEGPFIKPSDSRVDPTLAALKTLNPIKNMSFSQLSAYHLDDYHSLFQRVSLELSKDSNYALDENGLDVWKRTNSQKNSSMQIMDAVKSTAERVNSFKDDEDPSLVELLFHYGRYLLIACSRTGTQISNLQGIWSKDIEPPWDAAPHMNINLQMNYWPSLPCNLAECQQPLFDFMSSLAVNGSKTAKVNYEARGWVAHQVTDLWAKTSPDGGNPEWALWPMGGAWLCTHLWEHYTYTMDKSFLENTAYPLFEGCALFLLDWLLEGHAGYLETNPSTSPEHSFIAPDGKTACVSYSTTMDIAIIREVFSAVISSSEVLGKTNTDLIEQIKKALSRLPPTKVARDGSIMEWAQDFEDPEVHHRHLSHLFGLFPGHTISIKKTPELCKAAANSLYKRGDIGPGWSTTWKMALWARLHNSEHAYKMVRQLINLVDPDHESDFEGGLYSNLFTAHPPFQIDANFGFTAAISEMLVQSTEQDLYLLPALPRDKWPTGCVKGLKARGGATASICWKKGELHEALLWTGNQTSLRRLHYRGNTTTVTISRGNIYRFNKQLKCIQKMSF
ncbi:alpha-L-fucosidase 2 [Typha angustifolia]|uniref:alpha-L-fucosidase 2 n=1 Tax=Typha angustifolia TaxID=59011 RepID=UPI003C30721B